MKRASFIASIAVIVVANVLALVHALRNRVATPEAEMTMTQRELQFFNYNRSLGDDDSGVTLQMAWTDPGNFPWPAQVENPGNWLDRQKLQTLGFDCSVSPSSPDVRRHYERERPREVFMALEYDGAAWRAWHETYQRSVAEQAARTPLNDFTDSGVDRSHLVAIDADLDPLKLRARHPDRTAVVVLPAVVAVTFEGTRYRGTKLDTNGFPRLVGRIQQVPSSIHIPLPFSDQFRRLRQPQGGPLNKGVSYRVHLRYGASLEPWVTGVEFHE